MLKMNKLVSMMAGLFHMPNVVGTEYAPGWQPNSPGNSSTPGWTGGMDGNPIPWPNRVPTLLALASNPGTPHARAILPEVNQYSVLPENYLFIAGFVGKSKG